MNHTISWRSKPMWLVAIITFVFLMICVLLAQQNRVVAEGVNERVVTVFDGVQEQTFVTTAATVKEALERANVTVSEHDAVEPRVDTELLAKNYNINIYRARPVVVVDGEKRISVMSPHKSARQVVEATGMKLEAEDDAVIERIDTIETEAVATQKITIDRAVPITLVLYGKKAEIRTQSKTVGDLLVEKNITLGEQEGVSMAVTAPISVGMTLEIWRDGTQTVTEDQEIAFTVRQVQDSARERDFKEIQVTGKNGRKVVTYEINMKNGKEIGRKEVQSVVTEQPVEQIEVVGTKNMRVPYTGGGDKSEWLRASGIPESEWGYVDMIITRESGWNPNAINPSSGACGLAQALPCEKVPGNPLDPVDSLRWAHGYAQTCVSYRMYCGWEGAYNFWLDNHWW